MNFDTLCNIVLEGKKAKEFANISVVNPNPSFSLDDIMKDPSDSSKGLKTYLDDKLFSGEEATDQDVQARRALRRLNWVARSVIRRIGRRSINIRKLHFEIVIKLEQYLTNVLRLEPQSLDNLELKIGKEAAFIGNLLLPPSKRYPNAKGVLFPSSDELPGIKKPKRNLFDIEGVAKQFDMSVDEYMATFDPDLINTIKSIIKDGPIKRQSKQELSNEPESVTEDVDSEIESESYEGVSIKDILNDPRIKNVYDPKIVRKVIKDMIMMGSTIELEDGSLQLPSNDEYADEIERNKDRIALSKMEPEEIPQEQDVEELSGELASDEKSSDVEAEDEEEYEESEEDDDSAKRLGYGRNTSDTKDIETDEEEPSEEEAESWYKK